MDGLIIAYILVSLAIIIFQYWYIKRLRRTIDFAVYSLQKFARAMQADDPAQEIRGINWDDEFRKFK